MAENLNIGMDGDPLLSREDVVEVLSRVGLDSEQIATVLGELGFPSRLSRILTKLWEHGISRDWLIDEMGGSP